MLQAIQAMYADDPPGMGLNCLIELRDYPEVAGSILGATDCQIFRKHKK
jgi:hypothetical protein